MKTLLKIFDFIVMSIIIAYLFGLPNMLLWNFIISKIFNLNELSFLDSVGLNLFIILFSEIIKLPKKIN